MRDDVPPSLAEVDQPAGGYHLDTAGSNSCSSGGAVGESECANAGVTVGGTLRSGALVAGSWSHVPSGCSIQSGGDQSPHYNRASSGNNDGGYTPVCDGAGVSYFRVSGSTTCQGAGGVPVTDMVTCRAAAAAVGYTYTVERNFTCEAHGASNADVCTTARPGSCFTHNGELQLFNAPGLCDFGNAGDACLCARGVQNHLDITTATRDACVSGAVSGRSALTDGASCYSETNVTCATKYEQKSRGAHRVGQDDDESDNSASYDLVGELHLCEWRPELHRCEAGKVLTVCPEDDHVVEVAPGYSPDCAAPNLVGHNPTEQRHVCCPATCTVCGGPSCGHAGGNDPDNCCVSSVVATNRACDGTMDTGCVLPVGWVQPSTAGA